MKIVILSGGSGNDALVKGLKKFYRSGGGSTEISVIVNAYDNGKSTGVCRAVTDTLGVSDIRKNHARMYKAIYGENADKRIVEFYSNRYNFTKGKEEEEILDLLNKWGLSAYSKYVVNFFKNPKAKDFTYNDFSVSNIVYAQMYKEIGYEATNRNFCEQFGIDDFVVLNSFDNVFIKAKTQSGHIIEDEGETVFWNNPNDKIVKTIYDVKSRVGLNDRAIQLVNDADLIVISTGTFWSSIQPTIEYLDFYKYINASKAKKIWVMNNEEDGDSWGVNSLDFIKFMEQSGLNLKDFTILTNADARPSLRMKNDKYTFVEMSMGNNNGKHDGDKFARALLLVYYGVADSKSYDKILFDFDDTVWSRKLGEEVENCSIENLKLINQGLADRAVFISGNSFESIRNKLFRVYGTNLKEFNVDVWADANSTLFRHGEIVDFIKSLAIDSRAKQHIDELAKEFGLDIRAFGKETVNYKIKPLNQLERRLLVEVINLRYKNIFKAHMTGKTTVDVLSCNNSKQVVFNHCNYSKLKTLYIGDELDSGNDNSIAKLCNKAIQVADIFETNVLIKLLIGE